MNIYLYRHGETAYNTEKRYQGRRCDIPLSDEGTRKLKKATFAVETVYVTPLLRTRQTAEILFPKARQEIVEAFAEMDFGAFEGRNYIEMEHDTAYRAWVDGGCEGRCPGGESRAEFTKRVCDTFESILKRSSEEKEADLVIVAHGGTLRAVMERFAMPKQSYFEWNAPCGGGYLLELDTDIWRTVKQLTLRGELPC